MAPKIDAITFDEQEAGAELVAEDGDHALEAGIFVCAGLRGVGQQAARELHLGGALVLRAGLDIAQRYQLSVAQLHAVKTTLFRSARHRHRSAAVWRTLRAAATVMIVSAKARRRVACARDPRHKQGHNATRPRCPRVNISCGHREHRRGGDVSCDQPR